MWQDFAWLPWSHNQVRPCGLDNASTATCAWATRAQRIPKASNATNVFVHQLEVRHEFERIR